MEVSNKSYILSIDSGGSGIRAIIFDRAGKMVERAYMKTPPLTPEPGAVEHDPLVLWDALKGVIESVLDKAKITPEEIAGIGITNQRASFLLWEKATGKPLTNLISWADVRCAETADRMNSSFKFRTFKVLMKLFSGLTKNVMIKAASMLNLTPTHAITRLNWIFENNPSLRDRAKKGEILFGTLDTWFIYKLTGGKRHVTDVSNAGATSMYNHFQFKWNNLLCGFFDIPMDIFPEVLENIADFGKTDPSLFGSEIPIYAVAGDQMASLFGHCCFDKGEVKISQGSGAFVDINVGDRPRLSKKGLFPLLAWKINGQTCYILEGLVATVGTLIDWLGKGMGLADTPKVLNEFAAQTEDTEGVIFIPTPSGISYPYFNAKCRASIFGLSLATHRKHLARAVLEGIAMRNVEILHGISKDTRIEIKSIRVDGGVSKSDILLQILADLSDAVVERSPEPDMTATGVAYMAGLKAGFWKDFNELKEIWANSMEYSVFKPNMDPDIRKKKIKRWERAVEAMIYLESKR